jgi:hypothetical protein
MSDDFPRASSDPQRSVVTTLAYFNQWRKAVREGEGAKADELLCAIYMKMEDGYISRRGVESDAALTFLGEYYRHKGDASKMEGCIESFVEQCGMNLLNAQREAQEVIDGTHPGFGKHSAHSADGIMQLINSLPPNLRKQLTPEKEREVREFMSDKERSSDAEKVARFFAALFKNAKVSVAQLNVKTGEESSATASSEPDSQEGA